MDNWLRKDSQTRATSADAKNATTPIELIVKHDQRYLVIHIDYRDGLRYPHLERDASVPARLDDILSAR
jgi:hypothetical protein